MSRYIEADAVEKAICKRVYAVEVEDILAEMANAPSIDIIRCEECKHKKQCRKAVEHIIHEPTSVTIKYESVEFCSRGKGEGERWNKC